MNDDPSITRFQTVEKSNIFDPSFNTLDELQPGPYVDLKKDNFVLYNPQTKKSTQIETVPNPVFGFKQMSKEKEPNEGFCVVQRFHQVKSQILFGLFTGNGPKGPQIVSHIKRDLPTKIKVMLERQLGFSETDHDGN